MTKVITFGCRLNSYESEIIKQHLHSLKEENTVVINSCAVTNEAERQVKQTIRKIRRDNPEAKIVITGCSAQLNPEIYNNMNEVDLVLGNKEKMIRENYLLPKKQNLITNHEIHKTDTPLPILSTFSDQSRAFIQVQNGCNHSCTFCSTTQARGKSYSLPIDHIIRQAQSFIENGFNEIVLTGIDLSDYGKDLVPSITLGQMIEKILQSLPTLPRLRLSSIDVAEIDPHLLELIKTHYRLMPHIHISLQSGDNMILKRMKRRHSREQVIDFSNEILYHRPEIVIGTDIIAGFPTESDAMFQNTVDLISQANLTYLHVFPFSPKSGTAAARMPQVENHIKKERARILRNIGKERILQLKKSLLNSSQNILIEKPYLGRAENFVTVNIEDDVPQKLGSILPVKIVNISPDQNLIAEII